MTRHIILTILCLIFLAGSNSCKSQSKIIYRAKDSLQIEELKREIEQNDVEADSLKYTIKYLQARYKNGSDSMLSNQERLYFLKNKSGGFSLKDLSALVIAVIAVSLSLLVIIKEKWNKNLDFISEIDKQFISNPVLWSIYDIERNKYPLSRKKRSTESPEERAGKLKAFCYYKLNNFESVLLSTFPWSNTRKTWEAYIVHLIVECSLFNEISIEVSENYIYNIKYRKKIKKFLALAKTIEPYYKKFVRNEITREAYFGVAKKNLRIK